ncbi:MAG TPA: carbohydrate ABC transporter permease [Nitrososphaerales archaeon]|nr:carbohydrate ABC transporter permease [Nitrososphaerales archaeon]
MDQVGGAGGIVRVSSSRHRWRRILLYVFAILAAFYSFWPVMVMGLEGYNIDLGVILAGFAGKSAIVIVGGVPIRISSIIPTAYYYLQALSLEAYPRLVVNTLIVSALTIAIALAAGIPVAYVLARIEVRGKTFIAYLLLGLRTVSQYMVIIPLYIAYSRLGIYDTYAGVALAEQLLVLTVVVWMLRGFFSDIPRDVYEAATVFGKTEWQVFRRVVLPMVLPGVVVTTMFALVLLWNEFLIADTLTGVATRTVAVGVWEGMSVNQLSFNALAWNSLNAAGFLAYVPAITVMLAIRRYLAKGFSLGMAR